MPPGKSIPDRWLDYTAHGYPVEGTRFVALKVPLKSAISASLPRWKRFTPDILMREHPDVNLIIDLTNTYRYYDSREFLSRGVQYSKIKTGGHIIPHPSLVEQFFSVVDDYINACNNSETFIAVHCTHGVNRTGYFVCSYMIKRLGYSPEKAIKLFNEARGHDIERGNYIDALLDLKNKETVTPEQENH